MPLILTIKEFKIIIAGEIVDTRQFILFSLDMIYTVTGRDMQA
jgi:hypothetical protein